MATTQILLCSQSQPAHMTAVHRGGEGGTDSSLIPWDSQVHENELCGNQDILDTGKALNLTFLLALVICTTFLPATISVQDNNDRRILDNINYGATDGDRIPCKLVGASHENCRPHAEANAYSRGCSKGQDCRSL
ncbi:rapid alkalinization factor-like [Canna indica]|uniref:Rapid alkalinization factor-like n=1 Tax=Canna indica TaxID=4628 RepID=A0AAQ3QF05_9LILI|nr:rapid alkalinization factor-like [Canna indica]